MATNDSGSQNSQAPLLKKPYEKPSFRYEQVFVTTALACGKINDTQSSCIGNHSAS